VGKIAITERTVAVPCTERLGKDHADAAELLKVFSVFFEGIGSGHFRYYLFLVLIPQHQGTHSAGQKILPGRPITATWAPAARAIEGRISSWHS